MRREGPLDFHFRSVLRRVGSGKYKGTEKSGRLICTTGGSGTQRIKFKFRIVDANDGKATAIQGRAKLKMNCPGGDVIQKARLDREKR